MNNIETKCKRILQNLESMEGKKQFLLFLETNELDKESILNIINILDKDLLRDMTGKPT